MKIFKNTKIIKSKVVAGFMALLLVAFIIVYTSIKIVSNLNPNDKDLSQSTKKLMLVSKILSLIIECENNARVYLATDDYLYRKNYNNSNKELKNLVDSLKILSLNNTSQYIRVVNFDSLLLLKDNSYERVFLLNSYEEKNVLSNKSFKQLTNILSDTLVESKNGEINIIQYVNNYKTKKKENFFKRLWKQITIKNDSYDSIDDGYYKQKIDSILQNSKRNDTTLVVIEKLWDKLLIENTKKNEILTEREMSLLKNDELLMTEIRNALLLFETEELNRVIAVSNNSQNALKKLWENAFTLAIIGLIIMILFIIFIWRDFAKSEFYRKKMEDARRVAERLLKVKESFLSNMSHEIRTPITSIIGYTEQLSNSNLNTQQKKFINNIVTSSEYLLKLINDLLDYSKIENSKLTLDHTSFNISKTIIDVYENMINIAAKKNIEMRMFSNIDNAVFVNGDSLRISQILYNLLSNAIKFTENGYVELLACSVIANNIMNLQLVVKDTGIGIASDKQDVVFNEFTQADVSTTRKYGGTGLGLSICKKLVDLMDGNIKLESVENEGTAVEVNLKLSLTSDFKQTETNNYSQINVRNKMLKLVEILLVDDDNTNRDLINFILTKHGANIIEAKNGSEAFDIFTTNANSIKIVITDISMPIIGGNELADIITKYCNEKNIATPIIILTTANLHYDKLLKFSNNISDVIYKPFKENDLIDKILNLLSIKNQDDKKNAILPKNTSNEISFEVFKSFVLDDVESYINILNSLKDNIINTSNELLICSQANNRSDISKIAHRILPNIKSLKLLKTVFLLQLLEQNDTISKYTQSELIKIINTIILKFKLIVNDIDNEILSNSN